MQPSPIAETSNPLFPNIRFCMTCSFCFERPDSTNALYPQQALDGAALIHRLVAFRHLCEWQLQVENLAGLDLALEHKVDQLRQEPADRRRPTQHADLGEEQEFPIELNAMGSEPQMQLAARRMIASVGCSIFGSGTSTQRTSRGP
jgi:hypothetical protein